MQDLTELAHVGALRVKKTPASLSFPLMYYTRDEASREIFAFMEGFYDRQRLHQSLGYSIWTK